MIIGIDVGLSGAIGAVNSRGEFVTAEYMPIKDKIINSHKLANMIGTLSSLPDKGAAFMLVIESVHAMPSQGVCSMFNFGKSAGAIDGVAGALGIYPEYVTPQKWKKHFGLIGEEKDASRILAQQLFPSADLSKKKDHGKAEALLIARWAYDTKVV